ncbi:hypothetical protein BD560DRAFT_330526 [Blakeslea trispora]|nr:hypothetical protein BD560DRAFT_330526 [Blakeslea trispora]
MHTTRPILAESDGLFGKMNPWAKKEPIQAVTPAQPTAEETPVTFNVDYETEKIVSWKREEVMTDVQTIESTVQSVIQHHVPQATESWPLDDHRIKFQILKDSMQQTGKEVPNYQLDRLKTTQDVLNFFKGTMDQKKPLTVKSFFEENEDKLPSNLTFKA